MITPPSARLTNEFEDASSILWLAVFNFNFSLTSEQKKSIEEINKDLKSDYKMFRILQGDVGTGKTIVSLICAANVINSKFQTVLMSPTEILAKQHYELAKKIFNLTKTKGFVFHKFILHKISKNI